MSQRINVETSVVEKFLVVGFVASPDFQKCKYMVERLHKGFPESYGPPEIKPMLDVEWSEVNIKYQRKHGNGAWAIKNKVIVFQNGDFLGDFDALFRHVTKTKRFNINADWHDVATKHIVEYLDEKIAGCLYSDLVPVTCENFLKRCSEEENGYSFIGAPIHRIVQNGWFQCGGQDLNPVQIPSENYVVPHNRRGVLSMCNSGPHVDNSTQFFVTCVPTPWMNYKYVAFGQLLHGEEILRKLENLPTYYQSPTDHVTIVKCGDFKSAMQDPIYQEVLTQSQLALTWAGHDSPHHDVVLDYLHRTHEVLGPEHAPQPTTENPVLPKGSLFCDLKFRMGFYSLDTDLRSYQPFFHLPDYITHQDDEGVENYDICGPSHPITQYNQNLFDNLDDTTPPTSEITLD